LGTSMAEPCKRWYDTNYELIDYLFARAKSKSERSIRVCDI